MRRAPVLLLLATGCNGIPVQQADVGTGTSLGDEAASSSSDDVGSLDDGSTETTTGSENGGETTATEDTSGPPPDLGELGEPMPPRYSDEAQARGIDHIHDALYHPFATPGQAWADIDRDGFLDVFLTDQHHPNRVFMGGPDGHFSEPSWAAQVALADRLSSGAVFVDYDNDGWPDLYVLAFGANTLLRNLGGDGFVDVSAQAGIADPG
ncbi:MAG: VCBS repeat-containing protein, partial [Myxococcales bacterium]|nr:VCBS repeat-containing protein [Myxococcales bacterium]